MSKPVILCVDDEAIVLKSLKTQIKQFFGSEFRIETADNAKEALVIIKNLIKDGVDLPVVVSDHIMPGMKGDALLSEIYKLSNKTLNIMLTGQADIIAVGNAINNANLFRYIKKPWNSNDMNLTIKEAIRSYFLDKNNEAQKLKVEKLVIQLEEHNEVLEERVDERTKEIEKKKNELEIALKELRKAQSHLIHSENMASIGVLANGIAHEINNPINFIYVGCHLLHDHIEKIRTSLKSLNSIISKNQTNDKLIAQLKKEVEKVREANIMENLSMTLSGIEQGSKRAKNIIKGLGTFIQDDRDYQIFHVHEGIESTLMLVKNKLASHDIVVNRDYHPEPLKVECLLGKLNQVFMSIILNAVDAINDQKAKFDKLKGEITVTTTKTDTNAIIIFHDNGTGISQETHSKIFEPFFTTKKVGKGIGLGMSISFNIIKEHNGEISFKSDENSGTTVTISIPLNRVLANANTEPVLVSGTN